MGSFTTNIQLYNISMKNRIPLLDVISKDEFPFIVFKDKPKNIIINLANSKDDGTHWVGLYYDKGRFFYFDSFGFNAPIIINNTIEDYVDSYMYSNKMIQNPNSGWCGSFCLAFLKCMNEKSKKTLHEKYESFVHLFDDNVENNLRILKAKFPSLT